MPRSTLVLGALAFATAGAAACGNDGATSPSSTSSVASSLLATAFLSSTPGYNYANSSFSASSGSNSTGSSTTGSFGPGGGHDGHDGHGGHGGRGGPGFGDFMGGLGGDFAGFGGFGPGFGRGPFGDQGAGVTTSCTFSASTGVITCADVTVNGLTVSRSAQYLTAAGTAQQTYDTTTNTAITNVRVTGTTTFTPRDRHGFGPGFGPDSSAVSVASATNTVNTQSFRKVVGLATGSTQRTVNSNSSGTESTTGKLSDSSSFSAQRVMGDTVTGVVIPVSTSNRAAYPTAGTVVRYSKASVTTTGGTKTVTRREQITYDGSSTAKVVIVQNDTTRNCTLPLPRGRLSCS